jgi:hypothetical protein
LQGNFIFLVGQVKLIGCQYLRLQLIQWEPRIDVIRRIGDIFERAAIFIQTIKLATQAAK